MMAIFDLFFVLYPIDEKSIPSYNLMLLGWICIWMIGATMVLMKNKIQNACDYCKKQEYQQLHDVLENFDGYDTLK